MSKKEASYAVLKSMDHYIHHKDPLALQEVEALITQHPFLKSKKTRFTQGPLLEEMPMEHASLLS